MAHGDLGDGDGAQGEFGQDRGDERLREARKTAWRSSSANSARMFGGWAQAPHGEESSTYSSNMDDHYRSWRDRHMSELDRDYADYCREREAQFHSDFDAWRRKRRASVQPPATGMTQTGLSADPTGLTQTETETSPASPDIADPIESATSGTASRRNSRS